MKSLTLKSLPSAASLILLLGFVSSSRLNAMLDDISNYQFSKETNISAMCYVSVDIDEYFNCSICKKATLYDADYYLTIISARTFLKEIKTVRMDIDDSGFCSHCYPKDTPHTFKITVHYAASDKPVTYTLSPSQVLKIKAYLGGAKDTDVKDIPEEFLKAIQGK